MPIASMRSTPASRARRDHVRRRRLEVIEMEVRVDHAARSLGRAGARRHPPAAGSPRHALTPRRSPLASATPTRISTRPAIDAGVIFSSSSTAP